MSNTVTAAFTTFSLCCLAATAVCVGVLALLCGSGITAADVGRCLGFGFVAGSVGTAVTLSKLLPADKDDRWRVCVRGVLFSGTGTGTLVVIFLVGCCGCLSFPNWLFPYHPSAP